MSENFPLKSNYIIGLIGWYCDQNLDSPLHSMAKLNVWTFANSKCLFFQLKIAIYQKLQPAHSFTSKITDLSLTSSKIICIWNLYKVQVC